MKLCLRCHKLQSKNSFSAYKRNSDGLQPYCKNCRRDVYYENHDANKKNARDWYWSHRTEALARSKEYSAKNLEKCREIQKKWAIEHRDAILESSRKNRLKGRDNPKIRLRHSMSNRMYESLRCNKHNRSWETLVGFNMQMLRDHLEKQFKSGMTWENYGSFWSLDHKIPVSVFNFDCPENIDFKKCWSLENLQPLYKKENIVKHAKIDRPFQPSLMLSC